MSFLKECLNHRDIKAKVINCVSFGTIGVAFVFLLTLGFWSLYPYNPLEINERPLKVQNKVISKSSNEPLVYITDVCKNTDKVPLVKRRFSDGIEFALPQKQAFSKETGCRIYNIGLDVPHSLPAGDYILVIEYVYEVNPVRTITIKTHTEKFTITE